MAHLSCLLTFDLRLMFSFLVMPKFSDLSTNPKCKYIPMKTVECFEKVCTTKSTKSIKSSEINIGEHWPDGDLLKFSSCSKISQNKHQAWEFLCKYIVSVSTYTAAYTLNKCLSIFYLLLILPNARAHIGMRRTFCLMKKIRNKPNSGSNSMRKN